MQIREPDFQTVYYEGGSVELYGAQNFQNADMQVHYEVNSAQNTLQVSITAEQTGLRFLRLRWAFRAGDTPPLPWRVLGDEWERGYGTMEWRGLCPERSMPWYFLLASAVPDATGHTVADKVASFGVMTRPHAFCSWQVDEDGVTLWLDVRNGGGAVALNGRVLPAATVIFGSFSGLSAWDAAGRFCHAMSSAPLLPPEPVYGFNNWYYAYGKSSHADILKDSALLAQLTDGLANRPFMVIDDGWQINSCDGPWDRGNRRFPDMGGLAREMAAAGVRPGIWIRLLADTTHSAGDLPPECRMAINDGILDPSHPAVIDRIGADIRRLVDWGYQLIKHDFSSQDIVGRFGRDIADFTVPTRENWHFYDRSRTTAEIVMDFYAAIRSHAGDALILGCNCFSHLCAGYVHLNRTGDDTSGTEWERTRKMGMNTLAFRMAQHNAFYAADADCVGITEHIPWELNRQWLDLLAHSGSPLFVSVRPGTLKPDQAEAVRNAFRAASVQADRAEALDWMDSTCPSNWMINGKPVQYHWYDRIGAENLNP